MAKLNRPFSVQAINAVDNAGTGIDAAFHPLLLAAQYIEDNSPLPACLANHLTSAIRAAASEVDREAKIERLLWELKIRVGHRPQKEISWLHQGEEMVNLMQESGCTAQHAIKIIATQYKVSVRTGRRRFNKFISVRGLPHNLDIPVWEWTETK